MPLNRRDVLAGGSALALLAEWPARAAGSYPDHAIRLIVPYAAGGTTDLLGHMVADQLQSGLAASVAVENKPGLGTTLGAELVARSEPDGYTLLVATSTTLAINKTLYRNLSYDPLRDFAPIALIAGVPFVLIVNPSIPAKSLSEFVAYAKSKPGLAYASPGVGSAPHLGAELLRAAFGIDIHHVPYRGSVAGLLDVAAGHIPFMMVDLQPVLQPLRDRKVRAIAVTSSKRIAATPDIPTLAESGLPGFDLVAWQALVGPAATPRDVVDRLAAQIGKLNSAPDTRAKQTALGLVQLPDLSPDDFAAYIATEIDRWATIVRKAGVQSQ